MIAAPDAIRPADADARAQAVHAETVGCNPPHDGIDGALQAAIDAARDLAWRPTSNLPGSVGYHERKEAAERIRERIAAARCPADASDELRFLFDAMVRVCVASFANRRGEPYYERKRLVYELRGCLDVYDREARS